MSNSNISSISRGPTSFKHLIQTQIKEIEKERNNLRVNIFFLQIYYSTKKTNVPEC